MTLCALPDDVLRLVLEQAVERAYNRPVFASNLALAAVCQRLRHAALPLVYRDLFVIYDEGDDEDEATTTTNAGFVATAGYTTLVKNAFLEFRGDRTTLNGLRMVVAAMRDAADLWPNIRSLLVAGNSVSSDRYPYAPVARHVTELPRHCRSLRDLMPNLVKLESRDGNINRLVQSLVALQAVEYQYQLQVLRFEMVMALPPDVWFRQLTRVYIDYEGYRGGPLPRIDPARLETLELVGAHPIHAWPAFTTDSCCQVAELPLLKTIRLNYSIDAAATSLPPAGGAAPVALHFPQLCSAIVDCPLSRCLVLENAVFPPTMERLEIFGPGALYRAIADIKMPIAHCLVINIDPGPGADLGAFAAVRRLLANAHHSKVAWLIIGDIGIPVLPRDVACSGLTGLSIHPAMGPNEIIELIQMMPQLTDLAVNYLPLNNTRADITLPRPGDPSRVPPLTTKIMRLHIDTSNGHRSIGSDGLFAKYLLLRMPSLVGFGPADGIPQLQLFVNEYSRCYPHLSNISFDREANCGFLLQ